MGSAWHGGIQIDKPIGSQVVDANHRHLARRAPVNQQRGDVVAGLRTALRRGEVFKVRDQRVCRTGQHGLVGCKVRPWTKQPGASKFRIHGGHSHLGEVGSVCRQAALFFRQVVT